MVALLSMKIEYVALTLTTKETTYVKLLLKEILLLDKDDWYAMIKIANKNLEIEQIIVNTIE